MKETKSDLSRLSPEQLERLQAGLQKMIGQVIDRAGSGQVDVVEREELVQKFERLAARSQTLEDVLTTREDLSVRS